MFTVKFFITKFFLTCIKWKLIGQKSANNERRVSLMVFVLRHKCLPNSATNVDSFYSNHSCLSNQIVRESLLESPLEKAQVKTHATFCRTFQLNFACESLWSHTINNHPIRCSSHSFHIHSSHSLCHSWCLNGVSMRVSQCESLNTSLVLLP